MMNEMISFFLFVIIGLTDSPVQRNYRSNAAAAATASKCSHVSLFPKDRGIMKALLLAA